MKILILGGTGLISTAITRELLARGQDEVTLYNRGRTPVRFEGDVQVIHGDRSDFAAFEQQMADAGEFDCVIDMICFTADQAESAIRAFKGRVGHFIFCSTVDVYSKPASRYPIVESEPRIPPPLHTYGHNKVRCEDIFMEAHARGDFPVTILRPASTYGEGGVLIHSFGRNTSFLDRIRKGKPVVVHGDGTSLWSSCHVDDCAHAFVHAAGNPVTFGKAYHVTGEEWQTWNRYHYAVAEGMGAPPPTLVHIPTDLLYRLVPKQAVILIVNFAGNNIFDNTAAKTDLDFHYTIPFVEGVRRTVAWLDAHHRIENSDDNPFDDRLIAAWERLAESMMDELADLRADS